MIVVVNTWQQVATSIIAAVFGIVLILLMKELDTNLLKQACSEDIGICFGCDPLLSNRAAPGRVQLGDKLAGA